jgi:hypothetical protein
MEGYAEAMMLAMRPRMPNRGMSMSASGVAVLRSNPSSARDVKKKLTHALGNSLRRFFLLTLLSFLLSLLLSQRFRLRGMHTQFNRLTELVDVDI